jgi:hypothetical protein
MRPALEAKGAMRSGGAAAPQPVRVFAPGHRRPPTRLDARITTSVVEGTPFGRRRGRDQIDALRLDHPSTWTPHFFVTPSGGDEGLRVMGGA